MRGGAHGTTKAELMERWRSWNSDVLEVLGGGTHVMKMTRIFLEVAIMRRFGVSKVEVSRDVDIDRLMSFCHFVASMWIGYG